MCERTSGAKQMAKTRKWSPNPIWIYVTPRNLLTRKTMQYSTMKLQVTVKRVYRRCAGQDYQNVSGIGIANDTLLVDQHVNHREFGRDGLSTVHQLS